MVLLKVGKSSGLREVTKCLSVARFRAKGYFVLVMPVLTGVGGHAVEHAAILSLCCSARIQSSLTHCAGDVCVIEVVDRATLLITHSAIGLRVFGIRGRPAVARHDNEYGNNRQDGDTFQEPRAAFRLLHMQSSRFNLSTGHDVLLK